MYSIFLHLSNLKMTYDDRLVFCHFFFQELKWWYRNKIFLECSLRKMQTATFTVSYQPVFDYRSMLHWIYTFVIFHEPSSKLLSYYHWGIIVHKKWFNEFSKQHPPLSSHTLTLQYIYVLLSTSSCMIQPYDFIFYTF